MLEMQLFVKKHCAYPPIWEINIINRKIKNKHNEHNKQHKEIREKLSYFLHKFFRLLVIYFCNCLYYQHILHDFQQNKLTNVLSRRLGTRLNGKILLTQLYGERTLNINVSEFILSKQKKLESFN